MAAIMHTKRHKPLILRQAQHEGVWEPRKKGLTLSLSKGEAHLALDPRLDRVFAL